MASISSMTGYANVQAATSAGLLSVELRSVNNRFLDLTLRLPDELRRFEGQVREAIASRVKRGKMECRLALKASDAAMSTKVSPAALAALSKLEAAALEAFPGARPLSVAEILAYPGVVAAPQQDDEKLATEILEAISRALDSFAASREREGAALAKVLLTYCDSIEGTANAIEAKLPEILEAMNSKLKDRMEEALGSALSGASSLSREEVSERIKAELTLYALRMDVAEEINRLRTHVKEVRRILSTGGAAGRRLDFLMQELNREANTLGSKAVAIEMTNASLDLKLAIEKMREQIQNLE